MNFFTSSLKSVEPKKIARLLGMLALFLLGLAAISQLVMPTIDGPIANIPGGPFTSGELSESPADWRHISNRASVQFQTLTPPVSRTIAHVVVDGRLFISSSMQGLMGQLKQWPHDIAGDDRILLRIDGAIYQQRLQRVTSGADIVPVLDEFERKYNDSMGIGAAEVTEGYTWMYEVLER